MGGACRGYVPSEAVFCLVWCPSGTLPSFHQGERTNTIPPGSSAKDSRQVVLGGQSNARQIPSQLGLRQEGRIFSPTLCLWLFLVVLWGLQCSIRLDKGTMRTILLKTYTAQSCVQKLDGHTEQTHWKRISTSLLGISPHMTAHINCTARQTKAEPWWGSLLGASMPALPHTLTINKPSYSWEESANVSALKNPHKCTWTWRASGWNGTVKGTLK